MSLNDIIRQISEDTDPGDMRAIVKAIDDTHGRGVAAAASLGMPTNEDAMQCFQDGIIDAYSVPKGEPPTKIWFGLYYNTIVLLNGQTGAGKSSILYNLAVHAAMNKPLFDVPFGLGRPVRVLYIDPENSGNWEQNSGGICGTKLDRLVEDREMLKDLCLQFHDGRGIRLEDPRHLQMVKKHVQDNKIDLVILDPIANLFTTRDENDNSEAAKHMKALIELRLETGACIVICHHQGKGAASDYGRGASARLSGADVGLQLSVRSEQEDEVDDNYDPDAQFKRDDVVRLRLTKNRVEDTAKSSLFLVMDGNDKFRRCDFSVWQQHGQKAAAPKINKEEQARELIMAFMAGGDKYTSEEIHNYFEGHRDPAKRIGVRNINSALATLQKEGALQIDRASKPPTYSNFATLQNVLREEKIAKLDSPAKTAQNSDISGLGKFEEELEIEIT